MKHLQDHTYAFQPIVDVVEKNIFSYEALRRKKTADLSKPMRFEKIPEQAFEMAAQLGIRTYINVNLSPANLERSRKLVQKTLALTAKYKIDHQKIVIEITETEAIQDMERAINLIHQFRAQGIKVAIDDFGAGYSGLNLLANFQPDMVKLDMGLIRNIESHGPRQSIVRAIRQVCFELGIDLVAEGVETTEQYYWLRESGIKLFQGFLFAKPAIEALPEINYPEQ